MWWERPRHTQWLDRLNLVATSAPIQVDLHAALRPDIACSRNPPATMTRIMDAHPAVAT
jgi:hypothetical protein